MNKLKIKIKQLHEAAKIPEYATAGAACFDLHAIVDGGDIKDGVVAVQPVFNNQSATYRTGLAFEIPEGYVMMVHSRSGHGFKNGVRLSNCVGVIDSDYRGEVMVKLHNDSRFAFNVYNGDRIAQAMIIPVQQVGFEVVQELSNTERGAGGFGSTGK